MSRLFNRSYRPERAFIPTTGCQAKLAKRKVNPLRVPKVNEPEASPVCRHAPECFLEEAGRPDVNQVNLASRAPESWPTP